LQYHGIAVQTNFGDKHDITLRYTTHSQGEVLQAPQFNCIIMDEDEQQEDVNPLFGGVANVNNIMFDVSISE
jgi:hypothetical protein